MNDRNTILSQHTSRFLTLNLLQITEHIYLSMHAQSDIFDPQSTEDVPEAVCMFLTICFCIIVLYTLVIAQELVFIRCYINTSKRLC